MKVYFHFSLNGFSNCYVVGNDETKEAIIIDPGKMTKEILHTIEKNEYALAGVLITHSHKSHYSGLKTLLKIYSPKIYAGDAEIAESNLTVLKGDGVLRIAGFAVGHLSIPGHSPDSMMFKIAHILFTGDALSAGMGGTTNNAYSQQTLYANIQTKVFSQQNDLLLMHGHGPPSTVAAEKQFNIAKF